MSTSQMIKASPVRPFLKWAGNKYRILERVLPLIREARAGRLIEPFAGAGAVFLNAGLPRNRIADVNADLIHLFEDLRDEPVRFVEDSRQLFRPENNCPDVYYAFREEFNRTPDRHRKNLLFLYMNKHGYNGLCRYNAKGRFNVPFGRYKVPYFPEKELQAFARAASRATFSCQPFPRTFEEAGAGDVVYCDPPYVPHSTTANFSSYNVGGFGPEEQERLADCAVMAAARGATVILSNHDNPKTRDLYRGARILSFEVRRLISCNGEKRSRVPELLAIFSPIRN
ncbi:MAG: Dam family site-specific DNA-(adenine-N6)-methyltransferase [Puniceicoccaceae bacterium]